MKKSGFGMGVFLTEPAREGDLIAGTVFVSYGMLPSPHDPSNRIHRRTHFRTYFPHPRVSLRTQHFQKEQINGYFDHCSAIERHRGRNYVYGLNQSFSVDGTYVGNETRFINHAPKQKANGKVTSELVQYSGIQHNFDDGPYFSTLGERRPSHRRLRTYV